MATVVKKHKKKLLGSSKMLLTKFIYGIFILTALLATVVIAVPAWADDPPKVPRVEVLPNEGPIGTTVFVRIWDYTSNKQVIVIFGTGTTITPGTAIVAKEITDAFGYAVVSFPIDSFAGGRYVVLVDDGTNKAIASFKITPKVTLSETGGFVGDTVTVSGNGFSASRPISILLDDTKVASGETNDKGKFADIQFTLPAATRGDHKIKVQDTDANSATVVYSVRQKMTIKPSSAAVGAEIAVSGSGFQPKDVTIYYDDKDVTLVRADSTGNFTATIKVPPCADGVHKIKADDGLNRAYCDLSVVSSILVSPNNGHVGMSVGIQGAGFRPGFPVTINYDNAKMEAPPVTPQGTFTYNLKIPTSRSGPHTITVTDGVNTQKTTFTIEATAPLAPGLSAPADSARIEKGVHFEWSAVNDPSGVTYVLEIAEDAKFSKILLSTSNLSQCSFDLPDDNKLLPSQKAPYFWRVKAIDGASNEGPWSSVGSFYRGYSLDSIATNMPDWTKYTLIGLGAALVAFVFFWLGRILRRAGRVDESEFESGPAANTETEWGYNPDSSDWNQK